MARQTTHLIAYRDDAKGPTMYFGPFVSVTTAMDFMAELVMPRKTGFKKLIITQPFTSEEVKTINDLIYLNRQRSKERGELPLKAFQEAS
jgi:hypothetical protein